MHFWNLLNQGSTIKLSFIMFWIQQDEQEDFESFVYLDQDFEIEILEIIPFWVFEF